MWFNYGLLLINYRSTTTIEVCYRPNTFIFAMENLIYTETSIIIQKTFFTQEQVAWEKPPL